MAARVYDGVITKKSSDKTVQVTYLRRFTHPLYKKIIRHKKTFLVHDEGNVGKVGDRVSFRQSRPHSKLKKFELCPIDRGNLAKPGSKKS